MNKKRVLSLLLALVMVFGAFAPTVSMAATTKDYFFQIKVDPANNVNSIDHENTYVKAYVVDAEGEETHVADSVVWVSPTEDADKQVDENGKGKFKFVETDVDGKTVKFQAVTLVGGKEVKIANEVVINNFKFGNTDGTSDNDGTDAGRLPITATVQVNKEDSGAGQVDDTQPAKAEMVPFQVVDQNNHVLLNQTVDVTKLEYRAPGTNAWKEIAKGTAPDYNYEVEFMEETYANTAYRLLVLKKADGFEDGNYRVTFGVDKLAFNGDRVELLETEFKFEVKDGKVQFTDAQKEFFRINIDVVVKQFNYKLRVVDCDLNGVINKNFDVYAVKKDADGNYVYANNKPVADTNAKIYELNTNSDGFAGFDFEINPDGSVNIEFGNTVTKLNIGTQLVVVERGNDENRQLLNLWKLKDEVKYATTPVEKILEEPIKYLEARKDAHNNFVECEKNAITLRVRVETMPFSVGEAKPVPGAKVEVGLPKVYAYGAPVEFGEVVATGVTDKYGYVEFELPVKQAVTVWGPVGGDDAAEGTQQMLEMTMPYLVRQVDNGNNEGVNFNDTVYVMEKHATKVTGEDVYELIIRNNVDLADRLGGANRYETAVKMAERLFPNGLQVKDNYKNVVIASGDSYPDALTATTTAYNYNAPLLLTQKGQLPKDTAEYLKKVDPSRIVIVGGTQTINEAVEKELEAFGKIKRISGLNRYGTSVENAKDLLRWIMDNNETKWVHGHFGDKGIVYLASGENFPDALAAASPAAVAGSPLLLTMKNQLPKEVKDFIIANKAKEVRVIGGTGSVSDAVIRELRDSNLTANRIAGLDRSATSVEIAKEFYPNANHVFVTSGAGYADALTGATLAAKEGSPVLLLPNADTVSDAVKAYLETYDVTSFTILGGTGTVSEKARTEINNIILGR